MRTPTLTITRGLPGSGKTTWARTRQPGAVRVNRDDLRVMLHGRRIPENWAERQVTLAQRGSVEALLRGGVDVICDDTNLRARYVRELAELGMACGAAVVEEAIRSMHARYLVGKRGQLDLPVAAPAATYEPPADRPSAILVDLDGTVALMGDRSPYDVTRVHLDMPNDPVIAAVRAMHAAGHTIVYCSGRTDDSRSLTEAWLDKHIGIPYAALYMRTTGDQRKDSIVKRELFENHIRAYWRVIAVFDDRNQVVRMWRELGLTVFQVAEGNF
jgi:predicted kinase